MSQLERLAQMHKDGILDGDEFKLAKSKLLHGGDILPVEEAKEAEESKAGFELQLFSQWKESQVSAWICICIWI